jgi:hypothetical protein
MLTLCHVVQVFQTAEGLAIVLEYASLGDLADYVMQYRNDAGARGLPEDLTRYGHCCTFMNVVYQL